MPIRWLAGLKLQALEPPIAKAPLPHIAKLRDGAACDAVGDRETFLEIEHSAIVPSHARAVVAHLVGGAGSVEDQQRRWRRALAQLERNLNVVIRARMPKTQACLSLITKPVAVEL
jgi:hypothetical protein